MAKRFLPKLDLDAAIATPAENNLFSPPFFNSSWCCLISFYRQHGHHVQLSQLYQGNHAVLG